MKKIKLMIADDNKEFCNIISEVLSYESDIDLVATAYDGASALEKLKKYSPDILLLDIIMPILDGIGVLEKIEEIDIKDTKIIILSSVGQEKITSYALLKGASYYMMKPFDFELFPKRIREVYFGMDSKPLSNEKKINDIEEFVSEILLDIGIMPHIKGFSYINDALIEAYGNPEILKKITKELYPKIAEKNKTTSSRVERAIRHSIELASQNIENSNLSHSIYINSLFKKKKPTNLEFLAGIFQEIKFKF